MARGPQTKSTTTTPAKVRFVLLEAELPNGDLSQVTQALVNALKQPEHTSSIGRLPMQSIVTSNLQSTSENFEQQQQQEDELQEPEKEELSPSSNRGPRKFRTPKVLDMKLDGDPSFEDFARSKNPTNHVRRYLIVAAWFKEAKSLDSINVDHVYTCYRFMKWPTRSADFSQTLRNLKGRQLLESKGEGEYSITHLGLNELLEIDGK